MATIPSGSKFFSQAESVNTTYGGSAALKEQSAWYTIEDIADSVGGGGGGAAVPVLDFTWSKEEFYESERIGGNVHTLGISINNLTLDPSKTYNLLIKRWRYAEKVGYDEDTDTNIFRTADYKYETDGSALANNRANKIPITTADLTYYNFNQDFYFKAVTQETTLTNSVYSTGTGKKQRSGGLERMGWISLAFDLEITNEDDTKTIIKNVGKIAMISTAEFLGEGYTKRISYNKMT